ncbi:MAG: DUF968 domain-containing protein [Deltaproteobacteria bacterium]|nr:DUF968 domain-containing protein [Deltaproteobacteria bacterium]
MSLCKPKTYRSDKFLRFVRTLPCCVCGSPETVAHHTERGMYGGGIGIKGSDLSGVPLCGYHHQALHTIGVNTFLEKYSVSIVEVNRNALMEYVKFLEGASK